MSDAITSAPTNLLLSSGNGGGLVAVTVTSAAGSALRLAGGGVLEGTVLARPSKGTLELMTADGVVQLKAQPGTTLPNLPPGARLQFQMVTLATGASQLLLAAVNGRTLPGMGGIGGGLPAVGGNATPPTPSPGTAVQTDGIPTAPLANTASLGLPATIIRTSAGNGAGDGVAAGPFGPRNAATAPSPGGTTSASAASSPMQAGNARPAPSTAATLSGPSLPQTAASGVLADMPVGTRLTVRIATALPPQGTASQPMAGTGGALAAGFDLDGGMAASATPPLDGTIIARPPGGNAVVQTGRATLSMPVPDDLPVGTRLTLDVVGQPQLPAAASSTATTTATSSLPPGLGAQGWPALSEALEILATGGQGAALDQLRLMLPQPDSRLAASMVAFSTALRRRDARALVSNDTRGALAKAGRADVADRLRADLEALDEDAGQPVGENGEWRAYTMPMLSGGVVEPIRLYVRQPGGGDDGNPAGGGGTGTRANDHRFVLDFRLSQMGRLQLDGLVRRDDKLFDLILRTDAPLTADMRHDIMAIFTDASELVGTKGSVSFQSGGRWLAFPPAPPPQRTRLEA